MARGYRPVPKRNVSPDLSSGPLTYRGVAAENPQPDYRSWLKADLVALATDRGIDSSGTKAQILERLGLDR